MDADPIMPMLWGMGILALAFILYPLLGLWALLLIIVLGIIGMFIGISKMKSAKDKDK